LTTISSKVLADAINEPLRKLAVWQGRGIVKPGRTWTFEESIAVAMFARAMRSVKTAADASARAVGMARVVGGLLEEAAAGAPPEAWERLIFITATFADGEVQDHSARTVTDASICARTMLVRGAMHVEVIDGTDTFKAICRVFVEARAEAKAKVPA
jgi:hypothetical protein